MFRLYRRRFPRSISEYSHVRSQNSYAHSLKIPTIDTLTVPTLDLRILRLDLKNSYAGCQNFPRLSLEFPRSTIENTHARWLILSTVDLWQFSCSISWQFPRFISEFWDFIRRFPRSISEYSHVRSQNFHARCLIFSTLNTLTVLRLNLKKFLRSISKFPRLELRIPTLNILSVATIDLRRFPLSISDHSHAQYLDSSQRLISEFPDMISEYCHARSQNSHPRS